MSNIAHRITQARKSRGLSQELLAERLKISRGACGHWERGKALPSTEHLTELSKILNVRLEWLINGEGEMQTNHQISEASVPAYIIEDDETKEVAERYYRLSNRKRQIILDLLRELSS
ncbi:MAG: helix-turn-helix transcriptional regulator [Gammaproteobacteria bacterium]|nr:helix-turn-helix transcriptional regulator [Gammaproteobacteria bacterium]